MSWYWCFFSLFLASSFSSPSLFSLCLIPPSMCVYLCVRARVCVTTYNACTCLCWIEIHRWREWEKKGLGEEKESESKEREREKGSEKQRQGNEGSTCVLYTPVPTPQAPACCALPFLPSRTALLLGRAARVGVPAMNIRRVIEVISGQSPPRMFGVAGDWVCVCTCIRVCSSQVAC